MFAQPLRRYFKLRAALLFTGAVGVALGLYFERIHREERLDAQRHGMIAAAEGGDVARLRELLDAGAPVDSITNGRYPWTPLMHASFRGHHNAARLLIERGANVDQEDLDFLRPITIAAREGHWRIVRLLAEAGADASSSDAFGKTALDYAREEGNEELVRLLRQGKKPE